MEELLSKIFEFIGKIIAVGGGIAVISYGILKYFGKKWMDTKFDERLERFKRFQNEELEKFRFQINSLFNRITKIHQKEFEVLPILWQKLLNTLGDIDLILGEDLTHPDFNHMKEAEIREILSKKEWGDYYISELIEANDKNVKYRESEFWHKFVKAQKSMADFHNYLWYNTIFLSADLYNEFKKLDNLIYESMADIETGKRISSKEHKEKALNKIREESKAYVSSLEELIQKRLHFEDAT